MAAGAAPDRCSAAGSAAAQPAEHTAALLSEEALALLAVPSTPQTSLALVPDFQAIHRALHF
jgi:hypothetical protein